MATRARPGGTAWGGRVSFNAAGRATDPSTGRFLSGRQVAAREGAYHRQAAAREAARRAEGAAGVREVFKGAPAAPPPAPREEGRRRVPKTIPGAGRFLPSGFRGDIMAARIDLILRGEETEFVTVHVGRSEWRGRNNMESMMRGVAGAVIADAINAGSGAGAGHGIDEVSDLVLEAEADGYDDLDDWRSDGDVWIEPE